MKTLFTNDINGKLRVVLLAVLWLIWSESEAVNESPRVVVVGGALTEIIYELGGESAIVGVDTTSQWPEAAKAFPQVGYQRSLSAEGVLSLKPDLVLATVEAGPPEVLEQIRGAGVTIQSFPENHSLAGVENRVLGIADSLGLESAGQRLVERLRAEMKAAREWVSQASGSPRVLFLLAVGKGAPLASGKGTSAHAMIEMAGGENVFGTMKGYKPVSAEAVIAAAPDYLLVVDYRSADAHQAVADRVLQLPGIDLTPAGQDKRVIVMNGARLLGFGPRMPQALMDLAKQLEGSAEVAASQGPLNE